eukprot:TRINITY_DN7451_c0_g6_i1.p1 TRINITY_DN7451_c0_g6~~TRINITY_DN7451_c0_g6_i1.p1  ORF type:complete len:232 (+),score=35.69 TRINITY_DN7451_c0_g6_i1:550-1245(+)
MIVDRFEFHTETVTTLISDEKEEFLFTGAKNGEVFIWAIGTDLRLSIKHCFYDHSAQVLALCMNEDLRVLASASEDGTINLYNYFNGILLRSIIHPANSPIHSVVLSNSPIPCIVFFSREDKTLYSYSINGFLIQSVVEDCHSLISPLTIKNPLFQDILIYANERGTVMFRELPTLAVKVKLPLDTSTPILQLMVSRDRRYLLAPCADGEMTIITDPRVVDRRSSLFKAVA